MTPDEELRAALRADARLSPDLNAVRRTVLQDRGRRRDRHRWWATGLVAGCVLVISGAVAMSAIGADEQWAGRDAAASHTPATPAPPPGPTTAPVRADIPERSELPTSPGLPTSSHAPSLHASSPPASSPPSGTAPDLGPAPLDLPAAGEQLELTGDAVDAAQHCHSQVMAWPLVSGGRVDERALRSAVNECAVGLGDRTAVAARYTVVRLAAVVSGTGLWRGTSWGTALPDAVDVDHPILVVRLEGRFPRLVDDTGAPPTAVQIYVDAGSKSWAGLQFLTPVDPAALGGVVRVLPR